MLLLVGYLLLVVVVVRAMARVGVPSFCIHEKALFTHCSRLAHYTPKQNSWRRMGRRAKSVTEVAPCLTVCGMMRGVG